MLFSAEFSFTARPKTPSKQQPGANAERLSPSAEQSPLRRRSSFRSIRKTFRAASVHSRVDAMAVSDSTPPPAPSDPPQLPELDGADTARAAPGCPALSLSAPDDDVLPAHGSDSGSDSSCFDDDDDDDDSFLGDDLVIASATPITVAALGRSLSRAREISVVGIHVRPTARQEKKRPRPLALAPSLKPRPSSPQCDVVNAVQMQMQRTPAPPPLAVTPRHRRGHSDVANGVGLQLLVDTLSASPPENSKRLSTTSTASIDTSASMSSPIFSIPEIVRPASDRSSIDTYDSYSAFRRKGSHASYTSTIPTSVSNSSVCGSPVRITKPPLIPPRLSSRSSFLFNNSDSDDEAPPPSPAPPQASCRSSETSTFFCRGSKRDSIPATVRTTRFSIGLSSIGDRGSNIEDDITEDFSHYPGIDELKKQISWLAVQRTASFSSDEDDGDASDEDTYHKHLTHVSNAAYGSRKTSAVPAITFRFPPASSTNPGVKWNPPMRKRRTRRRTASSDCLIADVLDSLEHAGEMREKDGVPLGGTPWDCDIFGGITAADLGEG